MNLALLSLLALLAAILLSCTTRLNIGLVAIPLAWGIGMVGGMEAGQVMAGFPVTLFLTLAGVMLLFTQAELNGTLAVLTQSILKLAKGNAGWIATLFFLLATGLSSLGAGSIAANALVMPLAIRTAERVRIPLLLMAVLVGMGVNAGNLSPISPVGVVVDQILEKIGLGGHDWHIYWNNLWSHAVLTGIGFVCLGGLKLFRQAGEGIETDALPWEGRHYLTLGVIGALFGAVIGWGAPLGLAAFTGAFVLILLRAAHESEAVTKLPWGVILMVCGVTLLINLIEKTGGMGLFSSWIARFSTAQSVHAVVAFVTGVISTYSSTSGVVLPAFLPTVPKLVAETGSDPISIVSSMLLGSQLVDVSPLSTLGAMAVAAASVGAERDRLFKRLVGWSIAMCVAGPVASYCFFYLLAR